MVNRKTLISDLIRQEPKAVQILAEEGLRCVGCSSVEGESLEEAALGHGKDPELLIRKLNIRLYGKM